MTAPPGTPRPTLPPPQPSGPTHPTPTGPSRMYMRGEPLPKPPTGEPPPPPTPRFGQIGGRWGYEVTR
jgi:hypothetical protein